MSIETYGTGERLKAAARLLAKSYPGEQLVLLPVPLTRDNKHVTNTGVTLDETLASAAPGSIFVGYGMPERYTAGISGLGAEFLDLSRDEDYIRENAYITAVGTLGYILATEKRCPEDIKFGVIGYGRIGSALVRMLLFFGAKVKVFTSRKLTRIDLGECGISSESSVDICVGDFCFDGIDLLINTAPKDMSHYFPDKKIPEGSRLLELASGENFSGIEGVEKLPSLPEKMFPESAGRTYFESVRRFLDSRREKEQK